MGGQEATVSSICSMMTMLLRALRKFLKNLASLCVGGGDPLMSPRPRSGNFPQFPGLSLGRPRLGRLNRTNEISSCVNDKMWLAPLPSLSLCALRPSGRARAWIGRGLYAGAAIVSGRTHKTLPFRPTDRDRAAMTDEDGNTSPSDIGSLCSSSRHILIAAFS